jgi:hypothetical protein
MKNSYLNYLLIFFIFITLVSFQIKFHIDFKKKEGFVSILKKMENNEIFTTSHFDAELKSLTCLNIIGVENSADAKLKTILFEVLGEYSVEITNISKSAEDYFKIQFMAYGRRKNFLFDVEIYNNPNDDFYINEFNGICDFVEDINEFVLFSNGVNCN